MILSNTPFKMRGNPFSCPWERKEFTSFLCILHILKCCHNVCKSRSIYPFLVWDSFLNYIFRKVPSNPDLHEIFLNVTKIDIHSNNFQRPHFQFDTVWLIFHVKLWNCTTICFNKVSLKFFIQFWNSESFGDIITYHMILTSRHCCSKMYKNWL